MIKAKNRLGLVFFPAFDWAISPTHPEREERLLYTRDQVMEEGLLDIEGIVEYNPEVAKEQDVNRVHICVPDVASRTTQSHMISAGGAIAAAKAVLKGKVDKAFAIVRPPGHHARRIVHGARGFCNINIEAVMIEKIRKEFGIRKITVVDTDCHHGDGTQDIYINDPDVLFISLHQDGRTLYPGTGFVDEMGGPGATGYTLNIPLPPGTSDEGMLYVIKNVVLPVLEEYKPDIIINSAGQDNHYSDPITNMNFSAQGYAELNHLLNPHIAVLEGGYSIEDALPYVNTGIILAMAGLNYSNIKEPDFREGRFRESKSSMERIKRICEEVLRVWNNKERLRSEKIRYRDYVVEERRVYYDTDGIMEYQQEKTRVCDECSGFVQLTSKADTGYRVIALLLPWHACDDCAAEAYDIFDSLQEPSGTLVYLQDKDNDLLRVKRL
jgi:acetoin utilization deacetylase AcuC-like enzyme